MGLGEYRVAIVGAGPGGYYTAEYLLRHLQDVRIDFIERLPTPFGLVRGGVAPDHAKIKSVSAVFDKISRDPRVDFLGGVRLGVNVSYKELAEFYDVVVVATGAAHSTPLGVPGADLEGVMGATSFVGWYNGVPDCRDLPVNLDGEDVVVLGHGNVAGDIARILLSPVDALARTDIAAHALESLARSRVRRVHLVGRRGIAQAKFSTPVLRELAAIPGCDTTVEPSEIELNAESMTELAVHANGGAEKNIEIFRALAPGSASGDRKQLSMRFLLSALRLEGQHAVRSIVLSRNRLQGDPFAQRAVQTDESVRIDCGLVIASIGFKGQAIPGIPFDEAKGVIPNSRGKVIGAGVGPGLYVAGWVKRGANGIIGTNRADGWETGGSICADLAAGVIRRAPLASLSFRDALLARKVAATSYADWDHLDGIEKQAGTLVGKPREKMTVIAEMIQTLAARNADKAEN